MESKTTDFVNDGIELIEKSSKLRGYIEFLYAAKKFIDVVVNETMDTCDIINQTYQMYQTKLDKIQEKLSMSNSETDKGKNGYEIKSPHTAEMRERIHRLSGFFDALPTIPTIIPGNIGMYSEILYDKSIPSFFGLLGDLYVSGK